jgi:hypothetical protein
VASAQLALYQELVPDLERLNASVVGISVDTTWSHEAFARTRGISFPLLSDDAPSGEAARAYGVYVPQTGRSRRALFVIDGTGVVRWSAAFPDAVNPGVDGILAALETLGSGGSSGLEPSTGLSVKSSLARTTEAEAARGPSGSAPSDSQNTAISRPTDMQSGDGR